jgi:hypothetical protein
MGGFTSSHSQWNLMLIQLIKNLMFSKAVPWGNGKLERMTRDTAQK